ncbi:MAG: type II secretion system F family protein [Actinomycetia bacterium]|nr:type II secretion system F family protein [Actinomycetes bacterium]
MLQRVVSPVAAGLGNRLLRFTPAGWAKTKTRALAKAGWSERITAEQLLGAKLAGPAVLLTLLGLQLASNASVQRVLVMLAAVVSAFMAPELAIKAAADRRADELTILLPDLLDQLTISVEAGLGFESAIARMVDKHDDPLSDEFSRMLRDIRLGTSRGDALTAVADRTQAPDVRTMVLTLRQADAMGVPLARSLRNLAADMRQKRRLRAEERARQLPVKLIFPLGLCILPALFIAMLGPALLSFPDVF